MTKNTIVFMGSWKNETSNLMKCPWNKILRGIGEKKSWKDGEHRTTVLVFKLSIKVSSVFNHFPTLLSNAPLVLTG